MNAQPADPSKGEAVTAAPTRGAVRFRTPRTRLRAGHPQRRGEHDMSAQRRRRAPMVESQRYRDTFEVHELEDATIAMVSDPQNMYAWIQSDVTVTVAP